MTRHVTAGLKLVLETAHVTEPGEKIVIDEHEVVEALDQIGKLTGEKYPEATVWKNSERDVPRVHIEL